MVERHTPCFSGDDADGGALGGGPPSTSGAGGHRPERWLRRTLHDSASRGDGDPTRPILGEASPYFDPATGLRNEVDVVDWTSAGGGTAGNSPNHGGKGQNVATPGGATKWRSRADVGVSRDNIYTRADDAEGTDSGGSIPPAGPDGLAVDQGPAGPLDSYLVP